MAKQEMDESLEDYILRFAKCARELYGRDPIDISETFMIHLFVGNLANEHIRNKLGDARIENLARAFQLTRQKFDKFRTREGLTQINAGMSAADPIVISQVQDASASRAGTTNPSGASAVTDEARSRPLQECYACKEKGHISTDPLRCALHPLRDIAREMVNAGTYDRELFRKGGEHYRPVSSYVPREALTRHPRSTTPRRPNPDQARGEALNRLVDVANRWTQRERRDRTPAARAPSPATNLEPTLTTARPEVDTARIHALADYFMDELSHE